MTKFNPEKYPYQVVQPIMGRNDPQYYYTATPISEHLSPEAAWDAINEEIAQLKRQPGQQNSYLDWTVIDARSHEPCPKYQDEDHDTESGYYSEDKYQSYLRQEESFDDKIGSDGCYWCGSQMHSSSSCSSRV